jgi:hypothetical protein
MRVDYTRLMIYLLAGIISIVLVFVFPAVTVAGASSTAQCSMGVWDNFEFNRSAENWSMAAQMYGGENSIVDLVVVQAYSNGQIALAFPYPNNSTQFNPSPSDEVEPYLEQFDRDGVGVILSVQPMGANVTSLIDAILTRYGSHKSVIGINIDLEWKESGTPQHVSNLERDTWLSEIKNFNPGLKLFLTYYGDHTYFPDDKPGLVVLFDGTSDTQDSILNQYAVLSKYYTNVGIYTGYSSSDPPTATNDMILEAAPNTEYIIHTDDAFAKNDSAILKPGVTSTSSTPKPSGPSGQDMGGSVLVIISLFIALGIGLIYLGIKKG